MDNVFVILPVLEKKRILIVATFHFYQVFIGV